MGLNGRILHFVIKPIVSRPMDTISQLGSVHIQGHKLHESTRQFERLLLKWATSCETLRSLTEHGKVENKSVRIVSRQVLLGVSPSDRQWKKGAATASYSPDLMPLAPAFTKSPINLHLFVALDLTLCICLEPADHYIFSL
ncbi:hypothetical protein WN944_010061 [Citrus x changshan-huyou]|uniref:Uncharacterized protein n=1 Tax=Citrus x changshan-huyou TaxID=2935761 RepID=A0AAP0MSX0_9ROSI